MWPPGVTFNPTEEDMVLHYLIGKAAGEINIGAGYIGDIELYQYEPSQLSGLAYDSGHNKLYFFTHLRRAHQHGSNINRTTPRGHWRKTGSPLFVNDNNGISKATKTSLTYWMKDGRFGAPVKTEWLMKEYKLLENQLPNPNDEESMMLCLCVVYRKRRANRGRRGENND